MVYIILPVHDRYYKTEEFIKCLLQQNYQHFHLILIDDGSVDGTSEKVQKELKEKLTIIKGEGNWWWGGSLHQGFIWLKNNVKQNRNDFVLIMNNDTTFESSFINDGIKILDDKIDSLLTAYAYNQDTKTLIDKGVHVNWDNFQFLPAESDSDINCLSTRGLLLKMDTFLCLEGFYPTLLPHYLSDYEYTIRAHQRGFNLITRPEFKLYVDETTTGIDTLEKGNLFTQLKSMFSKKYKANPFYHICFILLVSPNKLNNFKLILVDHFIKVKVFLSRNRKK
jgi:GT2 family glycosyltransferase